MSLAITSVKFKTLTISDTYNIYRKIRELEDDKTCRSDLSLAYLLSYWRLNVAPSFTYVNDNLILELYDEELLCEFTVLIGENKIEQTLDVIFSYHILNQRPPVIAMLTESQAEILHRTDKYTLEHTRDLDEYILNLDHFTSMNTSGLRNVRQSVNKFIRDYGDEIVLKSYDLRKPDNTLRIINAIHSWNSQRSSVNDPRGIEKMYLDSVISSANLTNVECEIIEHKGAVIGFFIYSLVEEKEFCIAHIAKVNYQYKNCFDFIFYSVASRLQTLGIKYMNIEEDMGIDGIRQKKKHFDPSFMQKRYEARPAKTDKTSSES